MHIEIDIDDPEPQYSQLIGQVKGAIQTGALKPGDPLPSIRQLATDLDLNSKTVAKAYRLLERDSVVQTRGYRGTFVHPDARANSHFDLAAWLDECLQQVIEECRKSGATDSEIRNAFNHAINTQK